MVHIKNTFQKYASLSYFTLCKGLLKQSHQNIYINYIEIFFYVFLATQTNGSYKSTLLGEIISGNVMAPHTDWHRHRLLLEAIHVIFMCPLLMFTNF